MDVLSSVLGMRLVGSGSTTWDPASLANSATAVTTVTVAGAVTTDFALCSFSTLSAGHRLSASVTAADTVTVVLQNHSGGAVNLSSGTLAALVLRAV